NTNRRNCDSACPSRRACSRRTCNRIFNTCETTCNATCTPGGGGGGNNFWLPWPALTNLSANVDDYRVNAFYDDNNPAVTTPTDPVGRFPVTIDDSNAATTNPAIDMFANCNAITPTLTPGGPVNIDFTDNTNEYKILWRHWKDHLFYVIGSGFEPSNATGTATPDCAVTPTACIEVFDAGVSSYYAAIVFYSGSLDPSLVPPQTRELAVDKGNYTNYLESYDAANNRFNFTTGQDSDDIAYCISDQRVITKCSP
ncbi:MAG: hypothetical protein OQK70_10045, partial [Gammaproteobacteria bacterium]|nr:hypothetical protein [Gammaproteobacteria bacterium]